jgi:hypothetical protein
MSLTNFQRWELDVVTREPVLHTKYARVWEVQLDAARARVKIDHGTDPADDPTRGSWIIEAPWGHPIWHSYWLYVSSLSAIDKINGGAKIFLEGATHELCLWALNPDAPREAAIETGRSSVLTPLNFAAQIIAADDAAACARVYEAITAISAGTLSPDTDFLPLWVARFGGNMLIREGNQS